MKSDAEAKNRGKQDQAFQVKPGFGFPISNAFSMLRGQDFKKIEEPSNKSQDIHIKYVESDKKKPVCKNAKLK